MKLPTFKTQDEVPEPFRSLYEEREDGTWAAPDTEEPPDTSGLESALAEERRKREAAERLSAKTADELKALRDRQKADDAGITGEKLEQIRADIRQEVEAEYQDRLTRGEAALKENRELKLDNKVRAIAAENGVRAERLDHWWKQHGDSFDLTEDGKVFVKGHEGKDVVRFIKTDLKEKLPEFYQGTKADGGGAGGGRDAGAGSGAALSFEDLQKNPGRAIEAANAQTTGSAAN